VKIYEPQVPTVLGAGVSPREIFRNPRQCFSLNIHIYYVNSEENLYHLIQFLCAALKRNIAVWVEFLLWWSQP
jgi:hypothetical protein